MLVLTVVGRAWVHVGQKRLHHCFLFGWTDVLPSNGRLCQFHGLLSSECDSKSTMLQNCFLSKHTVLPASRAPAAAACQDEELHEIKQVLRVRAPWSCGFSSPCDSQVLSYGVLLSLVDPHITLRVTEQGR